MSLTLRDLKTKTVALPPRVLIYGPPGLGKTSLAAEFPSPVLLDVEGGRPAHVQAEAVPGWAAEDLSSFDAVMEAIGSLYTEDHDFQTVIFDTLDRFEPLLWKKVCEDNRWESIEAPGYGKGYVETGRYWRDMLDGFNALRRDRGMAIVLIAHSTIDRFDDPQAASYSRFDIRLHKKALGMVQDEVDAIFFLNQDATLKKNDEKAKQGPGARVRAEGGGTRWVHAEGRPAFVAKNRFGLPEKFLYRPGQGFAEIAKHLPGFAPEDKPRTAAVKEAA